MVPKSVTKSVAETAAFLRRAHEVLPILRYFPCWQHSSIFNASLRMTIHVKTPWWIFLVTRIMPKSTTVVRKPWLSLVSSDHTELLAEVFPFLSGRPPALLPLKLLFSQPLSSTELKHHFPKEACPPLRLPSHSSLRLSLKALCPSAQLGFPHYSHNCLLARSLMRGAATLALFILEPLLLSRSLVRGQYAVEYME